MGCGKTLASSLRHTPPACAGGSRLSLRGLVRCFSYRPSAFARGNRRSRLRRQRTTCRDHRSRQEKFEILFYQPPAAENLLLPHVHPAALSFEWLLYFGTCLKANSHCSAKADRGDSLKKRSIQLMEASGIKFFELTHSRADRKCLLDFVGIAYRQIPDADRNPISQIGRRQYFHAVPEALQPPAKLLGFHDGCHKLYPTV